MSHTPNILILLLCVPTIVSGECTESTHHNKSEALRYKIGAIVSILVAGAIGVSLPLLSKRIPALRPENDIFFVVKAFAAGVILGTGFIHILPDAFDDLTSPCLASNPWGNFPFTGFVAMVSAIATLMIDCFATGFYKRQHSNKQVQGTVEETEVERGGHAHGGGLSSEESDELIRNRVVSQVLELGIVVHSVIIGISLGASEDPETIKPLLVALSFHQFFEGMGLGGCISQAKFKSRSTSIMATFFSLTTPVGVGIGIGLTSVYDESSPTSLMVEGVFNAAAAGILIYMALVDMLAADFMNPRMQANFRLQLGANLLLLLGAGCMSVLAKWA